MSRLFSSVISDIKSVCDTPLVVVVDNVMNKFFCIFNAAKAYKLYIFVLW